MNKDNSASKRRRGSSSSDEEPPVQNGNAADQLTNKRLATGQSLNIRPECQFGKRCYRRSPFHFKENRHAELESIFVKIMELDPNFELIPTHVSTAGFSDRDVLLQQLKIAREAGLQAIIMHEDQDLYDRFGANTAESSVTVNKPIPGNAQRDTKPRLPNTPSSSSSANTTSFNPKAQGHPPSKLANANMNEKWEASSPYNFFLTRLPFEKKSIGFAVSYGEIFDATLGEIKAICHFNFLVEADWFLEETMKASLDGKETTIIYGVETSELVAATQAFPWLNVHLAKSPFPFGHHHTKMILIQYTDESLRFVVSTANLTVADWENRTQGVWISPKCPKATEKQKAELVRAPSNFKPDILQYLSSYPSAFVSSWIAAIRGADCSQIQVVFVGSAPTTSQSSTNGFQYGLKKMEKALKGFPQVEDIDPSWPLLMQCSSIATLGKDDEWVRGELGSTMLGSKWSPSTSIRLIYPSDSNVRASFDGMAGGGCLPYSKNTHLKQIWVQKLMFQWKAGLRERSRAVPHIKTYCRMSPDQSKLGWFLLTSANLSKAAWGKLNKNRDRLSVMSWEAGVLFIPHLFGSTEPFTISKNPERTGDSGEFLLPYDVPVQKYGSNDSPWFIDTLLALRPD